ncbi:MAG: WecB/TagA/CpsF family glycosyltransferase [Defluviitaleaceae bacterium]|nr:WecB/TagA/CpsF family glycosyltransferase [Defluviitaleaceae bacterium]
MKTKILNVVFDNVLPQQAVTEALSFLDDEGPRVIFTPNPEMVMLARKDDEFASFLNSADLIIPDGIGIVYASRLTANKIAQRVPGIELLLDIFDSVKDTNCSFYFLGAAPGVADAAAVKMQEKFPGLNICGSHHGYFGEDEDAAIIAEINTAKPDIVLVGLGFPRQEKWIFQYKNQIDAKIFIGVGGSFDVLSGKLRRAPKFFQKLGLEWLFRLLRQPSRLWRQRVLAKFMLLVIYKKIRGEL